MYLGDTDDAWRGSLETFAQRVSGGQWQPYRWSVFLAQQLEDAVMGGNARVIIEAAPQHGKSATGAQRLSEYFLEWFPEKRVAIASYTLKLARARSRAVRDTFEKDHSPTWTKVDQKRRSATEWYTTAGGGCQAVGVGGSITGFGADLFIIDDPHKGWAWVQTKEQREKVTDWYKADVYSRLQKGGSIIVIQTRWNEGDLAGWLQREYPGLFTVIRLPALAEANDPMGRAIGEALCPERYTAEELLETKRVVGSRVFAGLWQQRPAPAEGNIIMRDWIRYYGGPSIEGEDEPHELPTVTNIIQSWDLNLGKKIESKQASWVCGTCWGQDGAMSYLLDHSRGRWSHVRNKAEVQKLRDRWPNTWQVLVEDAASGAALVDDLRPVVPGIIAVPVKGSKGARLEAVAPMFESGQVYFPHPVIAPWVPEFVEELVSFPNADSDDQVDSCSQALYRYKSRAIPTGLKLSSTGVRERPSPT